MRFWAALLRALGTALILLTINEVITVTSQFPVLDSWLAFSNFLRPQIERLALAVLCFGAASGILTIHKISVRQAQATARRRPVQHQPPSSPLPQLSWETVTQPFENFAPAYPQRDLAPVAPDWDELPPPPPYGGGAGQRLARDRREGVGAIVASSVREAPEPSRITPGTEDQYMDTPPKMDRARRDVANPYLRNRAPIHLPEDRELLKQARDRQLRQKWMNE